MDKVGGKKLAELSGFQLVAPLPREAGLVALLSVALFAKGEPPEYRF